MRSAVNDPWPVSNRGSSTRLTRAPMFLGRSPRPTSAPSTPNARWRPSVIEVGPFRRGAPLRIVVTADHGGAARLDPSGLRRRFHRLADMSGVVRDDLRSSVTAGILIFPRLTFGHHHPNGSDTMLLVAHAGEVIAQPRGDSKRRRRARHPPLPCHIPSNQNTGPRRGAVASDPLREG